MKELNAAFLQSQVKYTNFDRFDLLKNNKDFTLKSEKNDEGVQIMFSDCYQHYIVQNSKNTLEQSYLFLDEALTNYPNASIVDTNPLVKDTDQAGSFVSFEFTENKEIPSSITKDQFDEILLNLSYLTAYSQLGSRMGGLSQSQTYHYLNKRIKKDRLQAKHTSTILKLNYDRLMDLFTRSNRVSPLSQGNQKPTIFLNPGLAMDQQTARKVISNFPQLCLYDFKQVEEKIRFMMSAKPLISNFPGVDWPRYCSLGYGAGFTSQQATVAIQNIPQILSLNYYDSKKYPLEYFFTNLRITYEECAATRIEVPHLVGSDPSDVCFFAFLHFKLGVGWDQCKILLDAFPTLTYSDLNVGWEIEGTSKSNFEEDTLVYLRKRLQIGTKEILAMMKTHSRLSTYSVDGKIKPTIDIIQSSLSLSSRELRQILLRMPSLIGMRVKSFPGNASDLTNTSSLQNHINFFLKEVNMTKAELKCAILKQPSLLQYSIESTLRPKLQFLNQYLSIPLTSIPRIIKISPAIMGLSLSQNLRAKAITIMKRCHINPTQFGELITTSPPIMTISLKGKIEPCLSFLTDSLYLTNEQEVGNIIKLAPRVLIQSIKTMIAKMQMIEYMVEQELKNQNMSKNRLISIIQEQKIGYGTDDSLGKRVTALIIRRNPSILCTTNDILRRRLDKLKSNTTLSLLDELSPKAKGRRRMFSFAASTANGQNLKESKSLGLESLSSENRTDCVMMELKEFKPNTTLFFTTANSSNFDNEYGLDSINKRFFSGTSDRNSLPNFPRAVVINGGPKQSKIPLKWTPITIFDTNKKDLMNVYITVYVSGSVFPLDNIKEARGFRRSGGLSIYFPQIHRGSKKLQKQFENAATSSFGIVMPENEGGSGSDFSSGILSMGFPFLRPSRNRCNLYACYAGLKVILNMLEQASLQTAMRDTNINIDVCTDSAYAWKLLKNTTKLSKLGSMKSLEDFRNNYEDDVYTSSFANTDLLYPLAIILKKLMNGEFLDDEGNSQRISKCGSIHFLHVGEIGQNTGLDFSDRMTFFSKRAALWQFKRTRMI